MAMLAYVKAILAHIVFSLACVGAALVQVTRFYTHVRPKLPHVRAMLADVGLMGPIPVYTEGSLCTHRKCPAWPGLSV